jgi:hypothetical protein
VIYKKFVISYDWTFVSERCNTHHLWDVVRSWACKSGTVLWYSLYLWFRLEVELSSVLMLVEFSAIAIEKCCSENSWKHFLNYSMSCTTLTFFVWLLFLPSLKIQHIKTKENNYLCAWHEGMLVCGCFSQHKSPFETPEFIYHFFREKATECHHLGIPYWWTHSSFVIHGYHVPVSSIVMCQQMGSTPAHTDSNHIPWNAVSVGECVEG